MAILQNTLIGRAKRSIGGVTFSTWKGLNVGKSKPVSVANPKTPAQVQRRSALTQVVSWYRSIPAIVNIGFAKLAIHKSAYNVFTGYNAKDAFLFTTPGVAVSQPLDIVVSKGTVGKVEIATAAYSALSHTVTATFLHAVLPVGGSNTDNVFLAVFDKTHETWIGGQMGADPRAAGSITIPVDDADVTVGDILGVYLFFKNPITAEVSDSAVTVIVV